MKKIKLLIGAAILAYEVYDRVKRKSEKEALSAAELEIAYLESELATAKRNLYEDGERKRKFKR